MHREMLKSHTRVVVKVGSSLLTKDDLTVDREFIGRLGQQLAAVRDKSRQLVLVTSGAVSAGISSIGSKKRPTSFTDVHVAAAVGQISLITAYKEAFGPLGFKLAQMLMTADELSHRPTYLNARLTLMRLQEIGFLPLVNEDDAFALSESRFGDNDRLAAEIVNLLGAQLLIVLTEVDGLFLDQGPGHLLQEGLATDKELRKHVSADMASRHGSGGMEKKLEAASLAAKSGAYTVIANGERKDVIPAILSGESIGTLLYSLPSKMRAKERWMATCAKAQGNLLLDDGAVNAVCNNGRSLLPSGVVGVKGKFGRGDVVGCLAPDGGLVANGMVNYDSREMALIAKRHTSEIERILGYVVAEEVIHCDNMVSML